MATQRQIEANRQNAAKSSGPRTLAGKSRSSRNAIKHGLAIPLAYDQKSAQRTALLTATLKKYFSAVSAQQMISIDLDLERVRRVQTEARETLNISAHGRAPELEQVIAKATRIDRYEVRAISRRKRLMREIKNVRE